MPERSFIPRLHSGARKLSTVGAAFLPILLASSALAQSAANPAQEKAPVVASERKSTPAVQPAAKAAEQKQASVGGAAAAQATPTPDQNGASNQDKKETPQAGAQSAPGAGGLVVFIDPVTKQIRQPEAGEIGQLVRPETEKVIVGAPLVQKTLPGGGVGIVLDSSFDSYTVVTKQPDGKLSMGCVTGESKARELVSTGAPVPEETGTKGAPDVQ